jgi:2-oxoisovalerate dehydrogenase E1 component alpha subunit
MAKAVNTKSPRYSGATDPIAAMLDDEGLLTREAEHSANVSDTDLRMLYRMMVICQRLDQEGLNLQRQGELGLWGQFAGHEAAQVGAALALAPTDWIFPYYRDFAMAVCRGINPAEIMTIYRGLTHGAWDPYQFRFAPFIIPVGTQVPHAVGFALGCKLDHEQTAVLVGFGEGATSTGDWHEAMNFAGVFQIPVIFFCENNQWAISVPMHKQVAGRIADRAAGYGFPGVRIDGTDVLTVYTVVRAAAERAREGGGPYLVEALTYRTQAHTTSDDPSRYRSDADSGPWKDKDPVQRAAARLAARGALDDAFTAEVSEEADRRALEMRQQLQSAPVPHPARVFDLVFANPPRALLQEKSEFMAALAPEGAAE